MFKVALKVVSSSRRRLRKPLQALVRRAPPLPLGEPTPDLLLPALVVQAISNTLLQRLGDLRAAGVTPVIVFDGARMPAKQETHLFRAAQRRDAYAKLLQARASGDSGALARLLARAIRISPQLTPAVLQGVREAGHQYVVSPYEADAQCAFLNRRDVGYVSAVITEDSDLVAFGATTVLHHVDTKTWKAHEFDVTAALQRGRLRGLSRDLQVAPGRPCDAVRGFGQGRALNLVQRGFINYPADVLGHITGNRGLHHGENFRERFQDAILGSPCSGRVR